MSPTKKKADPAAVDPSDSGDSAGTAGQFDGPSYEQARDELTDVVRALEAGGTTLEESLALWERGEELARVCRARLDGARDALERAMAKRTDDADGEPEAEAPDDPDDPDD